MPPAADNHGLGNDAGFTMAAHADQQAFAGPFH
jgi:hypothetical protein